MKLLKAALLSVILVLGLTTTQVITHASDPGGTELSPYSYKTEQI